MRASKVSAKLAGGGVGKPLKIIYRRIEELVPDPTNPRRHSRKQIRQIANSIGTFGFNVPVLVDAALNVISGHGRLLACRELGWSEVPTLCLDYLTPAQARAFMIADNRLTETATWGLAAMLRAFRELGEVRNAILPSSTPVHTGTECGPPPGKRVARWA